MADLRIEYAKKFTLTGLSETELALLSELVDSIPIGDLRNEDAADAASTLQHVLHGVSSQLNEGYLNRPFWIYEVVADE